jgi:hypothetical protein
MPKELKRELDHYKVEEQRPLSDILVEWIAAAWAKVKAKQEKNAASISTSSPAPEQMSDSSGTTPPSAGGGRR